MSPHRRLIFLTFGLIGVSSVWWNAEQTAATLTPAATETLAPVTEALATGAMTPGAQSAPAMAFLARFDHLVAQGRVAQAVRSALVLLAAPSGPEKSTLDAAQRAALRQRLLQLLPTLDTDLATAVLAALGPAPLDAAEQHLVVARALALPPSRQRTAILRRHLAEAVPAAALTSALTDSDPRIRALAAQALRQPARAIDDDTRTALAKAVAEEADPRVRLALNATPTDTAPVFGEDRRRPLELPPAVSRAPARTLESFWDASGGDQPYLCHSTITIDADGRAKVETVREGDGEKWHVRYEAWAWVDAQGSVVIDARGQPVEHVTKPEWGNWSPDSLQIRPDGTTTTIDDRRSGNDGETSVPGAG